MKGKSKITIVDVMVVIAILMILSALILPHFAKEYTKLKPEIERHVSPVARKFHR